MTGVAASVRAGGASGRAPARRMGGLHLCGTAAAHGHRQGAVLAQQGGHCVEIDRFGRFAQGRQINQPGSLSKPRVGGQAFGQVDDQHGNVGGLTPRPPRAAKRS